MGYQGLLFQQELWTKKSSLERDLVWQVSNPHDKYLDGLTNGWTDRKEYFVLGEVRHDRLGGDKDLMWVEQLSKERTAFSC